MTHGNNCLTRSRCTRSFAWKEHQEISTVCQTGDTLKSRGGTEKGSSSEVTLEEKHSKVDSALESLALDSACLCRQTRIAAKKISVTGRLRVANTALTMWWEDSHSSSSIWPPSSSLIHSPFAHFCLSKRALRGTHTFIASERFGKACLPISVPVWLPCLKSIVLDNKYCASMAALRNCSNLGGRGGGTGVIPNALCLFFLIGLAPIRDPQISEYYPSLLSIPVSAATAENSAGGCLSNTYQVTSRAVSVHF